MNKVAKFLPRISPSNVRARFKAIIYMCSWPDVMLLLFARHNRDPV